MNFDPYKCFLKIQKSIGIPIPKVGAHLGMCEFISVTLSYTLGNMKCDSRASLSACTFVSPYFSHKPKARSW
jgi:hypothetical protein